MFQEMIRSDQREAAVLQCYKLPPDLRPHGEVAQLNVPLIAFGYLLRRFVVSSMHRHSAHPLHILMFTFYSSVLAFALYATNRSTQNMTC